MTYKELLMETSSGWREKGMDWYMDTYCPHHLFDGAIRPDCMSATDEECDNCWEREAPDEVVKAVREEITKATEVKIRSTEPNEIVDIVKQMNEMDPETVNRVADAINSCGYTVSPEELKVAIARSHPDPVGEPGPMGEPGIPTIEDSGDRTEFPSGAVRDMRVGKGRFDIAPIDVMSHMLNFEEGDPILTSISGFVLEGRTEFLYDALNTFTAAYCNQMETLLLEVAVHFEEGAKKYGDANYKKGIPANCYIDSAIRHYIKWLRGDKNERYDRAFCWNLMCCIWEVDYGDEWRKAKGYFNAE